MPRLTRHLLPLPRALARGRHTDETCLSCGRPVSRGDDRLTVRGAAFHARCSTYRAHQPAR